MSGSKKTAAELMAELGKNPEFVRQQAEREQQRLREVEELRVAAAPLLKELEELGFKVSAVAELPQKKLGYEKAVPTLLKWLPSVAHPKLKEGIVRALSVPFAKPKAAPVLIEEFRRASIDEAALKWAIGNALEVIADDGVFDEVVTLVRDRTHGKAREMLAVALGNMNDPRAVDVLLELLKDEDVAGHAIMALGKLGVSRSRAAIERFLADPKVWVRKEAKKAIDKIDKVEESLMPAFSGASMNFDAELVAPFLERFAPLVRGFGSLQVAEVTHVVAELAVDEESDLHFTVIYEEKSVPLTVRIFKDDIDAPDLLFLTTASLAERIDGLMKSFCEDHRI